MKFTEERVMCTKKYVFVKEMFTNGINKVLLPQTKVEKTIHGVEIQLLSGQEKTLGAVFWNMKRLIKINFLEKYATANSVFYSQLHIQNSSCPSRMVP